MLAHVLDNKMGTFSFPSTTSLKLVSTIRFIFQCVFNDAVNCWDYMASVKMNEWVWSIFGMILIGEDRNTRSKTCPNLLCPPQIPRGLAWNLTRASAVRGRWPTAWAMARPILYHHNQFLKHNLWYYPSTFCRSLKWSRFEMFPLKNKFPVVLPLTLESSTFTSTSMTERYVPSVARLLRSSGYVMKLTLHVITGILKIFCC